MARAKSAGVPVFCQVQTLAHAQSAAAAGADIIVVQGTEAGGHGGATTVGEQGLKYADTPSYQILYNE